LQLEGGIDKNVIKNIKNSKNYLNDIKYEKIQEIIEDNTGKEIKYGTPEDCDTGILKDSEELQAIIRIKLSTFTNSRA
jgi:hypothetical protein